jgi:hypothetical protein
LILKDGLTMRTIQGWRIFSPVLMCTAVLALGAQGVHAADPPSTAAESPAKPIPPVEDEFPSAGGVLFGFLITVGLAVATLLFLQRTGVLQRGLPALFKRKEGVSNIRPIERVPVSPSLILHLVEVDGARVLIAEGRGTVGMTILPATRSTEPPGSAETMTS